MSKTLDHPMPTTLTRAYTMKACEDQDAPEVIAGICWTTKTTHTN